jgi:hypothetical protein
MLTAITALMTVPCVIHHTVASSRDEYGNETTTETTSDERCWLAQSTRSEPGVDNVLLEAERWVIYLPGEVVVDANDRIEIGADVFEVIGPPWTVIEPLTGWVDHIEATAERRR